MRVPDWFRRTLSILDPLLRARWGSHVGRFVIDRKAYIAPSEIYYLRRREARLRLWVESPRVDEPARTTEKNRRTWEDVAERLVSAEDGRRVVCYPDQLNQETYNLLCESDSQNYSGYASFFDKLEAQESRERADAERIQQNKRDALVSETYDMIDFVSRKKQDMLANGQRDFGMLVHGRPSEGRPLVTADQF